jgi:hypothetical protein
MHWRHLTQGVCHAPRYRVVLTQEERKELEALTRRGKAHAGKVIHARALLLCDAGLSGFLPTRLRSLTLPHRYHI